MVDAPEKDIQVVRKWLDGGCPSWGVPVDQIRKLCSALAAIEAKLAARTGGMKVLPPTGPYVDRLVRIFRDHPHDDYSAAVLQEYANEALSALSPAPEAQLAARRALEGGEANG